MKLKSTDCEYPERVRIMATHVLNEIRNAALVLADACEEAGLQNDADYLRRSLGEEAEAVLVDHVDTRPEMINVESLTRDIRRLGSPPYYLSRSKKKGETVVKIWARRPLRHVLAEFVPRMNPDGSYSGVEAILKLEDGPRTLNIPGTMIEGLVAGKEPDYPIELGPYGATGAMGATGATGAGPTGATYFEGEVEVFIDGKKFDVMNVNVARSTDWEAKR